MANTKTTSTIYTSRNSLRLFNLELSSRLTPIYTSRNSLRLFNDSDIMLDIVLSTLVEIL